jgi:hypothetical protein
MMYQRQTATLKALQQAFEFTKMLYGEPKLTYAEEQHRATTADLLETAIKREEKYLAEVKLCAASEPVSWVTIADQDFDQCAGDGRRY